MTDRLTTLAPRPGTWCVVRWNPKAEACLVRVDLATGIIKDATRRGFIGQSSEHVLKLAATEGWAICPIDLGSIGA